MPGSSPRSLYAPEVEFGVRIAETGDGFSEILTIMPHKVGIGNPNSRWATSLFDEALLSETWRGLVREVLKSPYRGNLRERSRFAIRHYNTLPIRSALGTNPDTTALIAVAE